MSLQSYEHKGCHWGMIRACPAREALEKIDAEFEDARMLSKTKYCAGFMEGSSRSIRVLQTAIDKARDGE